MFDNKDKLLNINSKIKNIFDSSIKNSFSKPTFFSLTLYNLLTLLNYLQSNKSYKTHIYKRKIVELRKYPPYNEKL